MMNIYKQVCTYIQAKRLAELGINATAYFNYNNHGVIQAGPIYNGVPAYTVAELGVLCFDIDNVYQHFVTSPDGGTGINGNIINGFCVWDAYNKEVYKPNGFLIYPTEAEARTALLIHLIETGKMKVTDCNKRLNDEK